MNTSQKRLRTHIVTAPSDDLVEGTLLLLESPCVVGVGTKKGARIDGAVTVAPFNLHRRICTNVNKGQRSFRSISRRPLEPSSKVAALICASSMTRESDPAPFFF